VIVDLNCIRLLLIVILCLSGCSVHYTDVNGDDRYIGLVSISIEKNKCVLISSTNTVGLAIDITKESGGINFGYKKISKAYLKNNEYVEFENDSSVSHYKRLEPNDCGG